MGQKTSQLQIRVSPEQKALLKRLAGTAGLSVSAYVLEAALPKEGARLRQLIEALRGHRSRRNAMSDLRLALSRIPSDQLEAAMSGLDVSELTPLQQNLAAAAFEQEAQARRTPSPEWTTTVTPLERPAFGPDLGSLRPYLLCWTPAALKRRNAFVSLQDHRAGVGMTEHEHAALRPQSPTEERLARLDTALTERGVFAELCLVGGATMPFVLVASPVSRRPRALFAPDEELTAAAADTAPELGATWLADAARETVRAGERGPAPFFAGRALSIIEPPAEYVLAMKCLTLAWAPMSPQTIERDISYLLRYLGLNQPRAALERITTYLNSRQLPSDLDQRLPHLT